ncbi:MAG TPA: DHHA1 domain-containing protein, partial [Bryobacteraceae bacterium]|nr:DHHA1 domain-containing protein [Bryobacteraceae bacterium]
MTDRLYYHDSYLTEFRARVVEASPDGLRVYLDRTAFYPTSGGQPFDTGKLGGVAVSEVMDEDDGRIAHRLAAPLAEREVSGAIDWARRFDHMQQHTGQHLLSAVLLDLFDAPTVSFHLGADASTIDVAHVLDAGQIRKAELRASQVVFENRPVEIGFQDSSEDLALRKPTKREGAIRIVSIRDLDRSACGGTHVRATGEIGPILLRKLDRIRGNQRIEFVCGMRAVKRARSDYEALSAIARTFSAQLDETPALVTAQMEKLQESDKARRKLSAELAQARGRERYASTAPGTDGIRRVLQRVEALSDDLRSEAQSFTSGEKSVFLVVASDPASILLAASKDSGINAGELLKAALTKAGGRGGGSPAMAQGSLPSKDLIEGLLVD